MKITSDYSSCLLTALLLIVLIAVCPPVASAQAISAAEGKIKVNSGALLVDVRTPGEFSEGHVAGALNIPYDQVEKRIAELGDNKDREIVLYCRTGRRSEITQELLRAQGFKYVFSSGGYADWNQD